MDELSRKLAGDDVSAEEMRERLDKTEVTQHEEEALVEITELFKEMESVEGEERRKTSESIVQAAKRWPEKVAKHSEQLVDFVTDDNYYVRKNATFALGLVGDERHVDFLQKVAKKDDDLEDVARWSAKRIQAEDGEEDEQGSPSQGEAAEELDDDTRGEETGREAKDDQVETRQIGDDGRGNGDQDGDRGVDETETGSVLDDRTTEAGDSSNLAEEPRSTSKRSSSEPDADTESSTSTEISGTSGGSRKTSSVSEDDGASRRSTSDSRGDTEGLYREMALTLYAQGDGHREAVEQAAVQVVSRNGSLQPLVEALDGEGDEPLFAARTLARISEKEPGSLRENVSVLSDVMSRKDGEVSDKLEETLVNVARETPESLVEELSKRE